MRNVVHVSLIQAGGSDGGLEDGEFTKADYTYNAFDGTRIVAMGVKPLSRTFSGSVSPASNGLGYFTEAGSFVLVSCDESPNIAACCV